MRCEDKERKTERILYLIFDFMDINCQAPLILIFEHLFFPRTHPGTWDMFVKNFTGRF